MALPFVIAVRLSLPVPFSSANPFPTTLGHCRDSLYMAESNGRYENNRTIGDGFTFRYGLPGLGLFGIWLFSRRKNNSISQLGSDSTIVNAKNKFTSISPSPYPSPAGGEGIIPLP